ncbi:ABC transporter substrate-binding protein [Mesorhizobium shangrilense]|uniref:ABC transporter substrate-binding protein n=1 Tax=Mesorhizobium shangrilense TaxID=460060 RepID=A0ABV2DS47_9HYPH
MIKTRRIQFALAGVLALIASDVTYAQTIPDVPRDRTLVVAFNPEAPTYRNVGQANPYSINIDDMRGSIINMFEPLFYYNTITDKLIPWLAKSLEYNDSNTQLTIHLRSGVTWSDGEPFSADDVVFTLRLLKSNGETKKDMVKATAVAEDVASVEKIDQSTVVIHLTKPDPRFAFRYLINCFESGLQWLPEHIWKDVADPASFSFYDPQKGWPVTTSPWKVVRFTDTQIFMDRRDKWWASDAGLAKMPAIERIITVPGGTNDHMAQLMLANQADIAFDLPVPVVKQILSRNPKVTTFSGNNPPFGSADDWPPSLYFNHKDPIWQDAHLRHAVNYYLDRKQLVDVGFEGATHPIFSPFPGFGTLKPYIDAIKPLADKYGIGVYDPARGDQEMAAAGYAKNSNGMWQKDGKLLSSTIETIPTLGFLGPLVAQQLKNHGLDIGYQSSPESRAIMRDGKYQLALFGHRGSDTDPFATLDAYTSKNAIPVGEPTLFLARWSNAEYDKIVAQVGHLRPGDPGILPLVKAAMEIWLRDAVEAPICEFYLRIPMNQTHWTNWPSEQNPYMQPTFWLTSGQFGYVLWQLKPVQ